jgi:hypothetical protein
MSIHQKTKLYSAKNDTKKMSTHKEQNYTQKMSHITYADNL